LYEVHTSLEQAFKRWRGADFSSVRQIICPSQWVRNRVSQLVDFGKIDIAVVPNFVDRELFCAGGQSVELSADPVVWVGKLNSEKNVIDAIRIFQKVNSTRRISPVFVIGGGTSRDRMQQFINQLFGYGLAEQSLVLRNISNMRMASVLNGVRRRGGVYLSTSKYESFGISILEAAACGVPVVASRNGGSSEVLNHDSQESVFDGGDVNGAAEKILTLLKDPERYHLSSAQSLKVASRFKAELAVEKYHTLLSRSLPENRSQNQRH
jgi:glycosyltransferase involved in cell wall biosynthesis